MSDAGKLQLKLLGHFQVIDKTVPLIAILRPRAQRLLVYLLLHRRQPHPREHIAFTLWPDCSEKESLATLRRALNELRSALPPLAENEWVVTAYGELGWNDSAPYWLDIEVFEQLIHQATVTALDEAVTLYTGDLLAELDEEWLWVERERLRRPDI